MLPSITFKGALAENFSPGRNGKLPNWIVCHRMVGFLGGTDSTFAKHNKRGPVSTHFGIGRRPNGGSVAISQYVSLDDTAFGNGNNVDKNGIEVDSEWNRRQFPSRPNRHTISIEHEDGATGHRGIVDEEIIATSIELVALLLSGDPARVRAAGIKFKKDAVVEALGRIPRDSSHIIDHHFIAGGLKPRCWRTWLDDAGFPQARYMKELGGVMHDGGDDMPLLIGRPTGKKIGTATVRPQGSNFIFANNTRVAIKGGTVRNVMGLVMLAAPLDKHGGDRTTLLLVQSPKAPHWGFLVAGDTDWPAGQTTPG